MAVFEYLAVDESLHRLILERAAPYTLRHAAERSGMVTMADHAKNAALEGLTTVAEIQRVILSAEDAEQLCGGCGCVVGVDFLVCPFCQTELKERCEGCDSPVESDWEACPNCARELVRESRRAFCRNCLAPVASGWSACKYCGTTLP
jgi:RNA polymerase subunit RPABC4/transcription elongation factor Spt4